MLYVPFTLLAGAALSVALVTAAPAHDMTLNTPAQVTAPGAVADRSPSLEGCPDPSPTPALPGVPRLVLPSACRGCRAGARPRAGVDDRTRLSPTSVPCSAASAPCSAALSPCCSTHGAAEGRPVAARAGGRLPVDSVACRAATDGSPTICSPARRARRTPAASSGSGPRARRSPSSPTSASTPCSTAARSRPASRSATAARSWSTRTWAWSPRSSTSPRSTSLQGPPRDRPRALLHHRRQHLGERPADVPRRPRPARSRWATTAT